MAERNYLLIGIDEWIVERGAVILGTTLGSCVSVCLWDRKTLTGGLNHFLLPGQAIIDGGSTNLNKRSYGKGYRNDMMDILLQQMVKKGVQVSDLSALIVGGATSDSDFFQIGKQNLKSAAFNLEQKGVCNIKVSGGGHYSRRIHFYVDEGKVVIKKIDLTHGRKLKEHEEIIYL